MLDFPFAFICQIVSRRKVDTICIDSGILTTLPYLKKTNRFWIEIEISSGYRNEISVKMRGFCPFSL
ncbi:hypothetical protein LEP1GSC169_3101 [Leptospira santarosai str. HAI1349]|nr:hypothetical protein LEP1GSC169_3101 [Leptospira santarosai str. HAI1349]